VPDVQPLKSSGDLRAEMVQLDIDMAALDGRRSTVDCQIKFHALAARRGDPAAVKGVAEARSKKVSIGVEADLMAAARSALDAELQAAIDREAAAARAAHAAEALALAEAIEPIGGQLDEALAVFKEAYVDLKRRLHHAEQRGFGPGAALVGTALANAWRNMLWTVTELEVKPPGEGPRRSFSSLTSSWAGAARGASQRLLAPPALPPSPKSNGAAHPAPSRPIPRQTDIGERFKDDPKEFVIKDPKELAR
jgi:hypothetical protein